MTLTDQICANAMLLLRDMEDEDRTMLQMLCRAAEVSLQGKLRSGITVEDCKADFVAAASLYALAAMTELDAERGLEHISVGDLTLRRSGKDPAACCLRYQAEMLMQPYVRGGFVFTGV